MKLLLAILALVVGLALLRRMSAFFLVPLVGSWMGRAIGQAALGQQPDTIHLEAVDPDAWLDRDAAHELAWEFAEQGFAGAGTNRIVEMQAFRVHLLVHEADRLVAAIYEHPQAGQWFDVVAGYADGTSITFTTARETGLDPRPGHPVVHAPPTSPRALIERLRWERPAGTLRPATIDSVVRDFETAYADSTAWRKGRGISAAEVARVAVRKAA
jgi:hypothetical protein